MRARVCVGQREKGSLGDRLKVSCLVVPPPRVGVGVSAHLCLFQESWTLVLWPGCMIHTRHPAGIWVMRPVDSLSAMYLPT